MNTLFDDTSNVPTGNISTDGAVELRQTNTNVVKFEQKKESVMVDSRNIKKPHSICEDVNSQRFPWADVMLSVASLFAGTFISAIISGISLDGSVKSVVFYILSPVIAVGCGVAFFFTRRIERKASYKQVKKPHDYAKFAGFKRK